MDVLFMLKGWREPFVLLIPSSIVKARLAVTLTVPPCTAVNPLRLMPLLLIS